MSTTASSIQVFAKPVGPICNLNCSYCYYVSKEDRYPRGHRFPMSNRVLETYTRQVIAATPERQVQFLWHGGEPMLLGLDFFRRAVAMQKKWLRASGKTARNGIQVNGTLLDDAWCEFLRAERFHVGISLDGPRDIHDTYRKTKAGAPSFDAVMAGYRRLRKHGLDPDILCVVNAHNARHPMAVYHFFKEIGARYLGFIPLVEPAPTVAGAVSERSVGAGAFGSFLSAIFDEWVRQDVGRVMVQMFEETSRVAMGEEHGLCIFRRTCGHVPVVEHDGEVYACDHYVTDDYRVGHLHELPLSEILTGSSQRAFGEAKWSTLPRYCRECEFLEFCHGGCPKDRIIETPDSEAGLNYLCAGYRQIFGRMRTFVARLRDEARRGLRPDPRAGRTAKVGRNDPCPCGSGKKYKRCCA